MAELPAPDSGVVVRGAREHNLRSVDVTIPRNKLVVVTGVSGSGKSSLAFDTIDAEGQRRYVESLSAYVRQFIGLLEKPDVDSIEGLSPAVSIDQKGVSRNPRSTVGTITEVYDYLRLLFARVGRPHCPNCGLAVSRQTVQQIVDEIAKIADGTRVLLLAPLVVHMKGEHHNVLGRARREGFARVRVDGAVLNLNEEIKLNKRQWHDIEVVVDRLVIKEDMERDRLTQSVETALKLADGVVVAAPVADDGTAKMDRANDIVHSERFACVKCGVSIQELEPRNFSFNTPFGACPECTGLGFKLIVTPELVVQSPQLSLSDGALAPWAQAGGMSAWYKSVMSSAAKRFGVPLDVPFRELSDEHRELVLYGSKGVALKMVHTTRTGSRYSWRTKFEGVINSLERRYRETESQNVRESIEQFMEQQPCQVCNGLRLKPEVLAVTIRRRNIMEVCQLPVEAALEWIEGCVKLDGEPRDEGLTERDLSIGRQIFKEIIARLQFLDRVGLGYINIDRMAATLSGGEAQRIRLATQIGAGLTGVLYVCDEPSVGLHPADNARLIGTLTRLRDVGNTVIVVEHDEAVMRAADHIIDMGPGAGIHGGRVVAEGSIEAIEECAESLTGEYLSGRRSISAPPASNEPESKHITVEGARANNLKDITVEIPLGRLVCVTGVSGSGKSTLVNEILFKAINRQIYRAKERPGAHEAIRGLEHIDKIINIDQSAIGRTPRSNPATYTGVFTYIRDLFAATREAKVRGYKSGRFSFNVKGGRCEACSGAGYNQIEMQFLPDITVPCDECRGARYNREALEILFKGSSIADVLGMTLREAHELFRNIPRINNKLETMMGVGLDYINLGQPATTLSGGEAQRIKLAAELSKRSTGRTLYILDEPTTGLSLYDSDKLLKVLRSLVDRGNTVVLIEHHLDFIKNADWIVDLGPGAGARGGGVVGCGTPQQIAAVEGSLTGGYLKEALGAG